MKNYDVMIYGQVSFYHSVKNKTRKSDSIRNISTRQGHDCKMVAYFMARTSKKNIS